jgi:hypothetical protein
LARTDFVAATDGRDGDVRGGRTHDPRAAAAAADLRDVEVHQMSETEPARESDLIHRLKNHLCIIVGFCDLLLADCPAGEQRHGDLLEVQKAARDAMEMMPAITERMR